LCSGYGRPAIADENRIDYDPEPAARFVNEESKIIVIKGFKA
jgi:hypothetical protein